MPYRKEELEKSVNTIIGQEIFSSLTLPRATEEAAIVLFLNDDAHDEAIQLIKEAVSDLRDFGHFKFLDR